MLQVTYIVMIDIPPAGIDCRDDGYTHKWYRLIRPNRHDIELNLSMAIDESEPFKG